MDISGTIEPITLICVSLERSFPPAKAMTSEVELRPMLRKKKVNNGEVVREALSSRNT